MNTTEQKNIEIKLGSKLTKSKLESQNFNFKGQISFDSRPTVNGDHVATENDLLGVVSTLSDYVEKNDFDNYIEEKEQEKYIQEEQFLNFSRSYNFSSSHNGNWTAIAISSNGQYRYASTLEGEVYFSTDNGQTWSNTGVNVGNPINSICTSDNGQYVAFTTSDYQNSVSNYIYISNDFGANFTTTAQIKYWTAITMSSTGKYIVACSLEYSNIYSNDFGLSWITGTIQNGTCVTSSASGRIVYMGCAGDAVYKSDDYGKTWLRREVGNYEWSSMATSADGKYLLVVAKDNRKVIQSSNYGVDFIESPSESNHPPGLSDRENITGVCISGSGQYQLICIFNGPICYSSNYGQSWNYIGPSDGLVCIAISRDGKYYSTCKQGVAILNGHSDVISVMYTVTDDNTNAPLTTVTGSFYFDSINNTFKIYNGSQWLSFQATF